MTHDREPQDRLQREQNKVAMHDYNSAYYNKAANSSDAPWYILCKIFLYVLVINEGQW